MSQHGGNSVHRQDTAGGKVSPGMGRLNLYYYQGDNLILLQEKNTFRSGFFSWKIAEKVMFWPPSRGLLMC